MCDMDTDGNRWAADRRRTRRHRWCEACKETIPRGHHYVRIACFDGGDVLVYVQCDRCHALFNALARMRPGEAIRFDLGCGKYIDDPEHPLQRLAFALPTDAAVQP